MFDRTKSRPRKSNCISAGFSVGATLTCLASFVALSSSANAQTVYEGFNPIQGAAIDTQTGGTGFTSSWTDQSPGEHFTVASSLSYTDINGNMLNTTGGLLASIHKTTGSIANRSFTTLTPNSGVGSKKVYYLSFLINPVDNPNPLSPDFSYGGIAIGENNVNKYAFIGIAGGTDKYTIQSPAVGFPVAPGTSSSVSGVQGRTKFLVAKLTLDPISSLDQIDLWVDPLLGAPLGAPTVSNGSLSLDLGNVSQFFIKNSASNGAGSYSFDEIRLGDTYASVSPFGTGTSSTVPEPGSLALLAGTVVTGGLFSIRRQKAPRR